MSQFSQFVNHEHAHAQHIKNAKLQAAAAAVHAVTQRYNTAYQAVMKGKITEEEFKVVWKQHQAAGEVYAKTYTAIIAGNL